MAIKNYAENWIDTYNSYLGAINFTTTDMAELVSAIRQYVTRQTPEGVNDWQSSSEIGIFTNAIAYLGENLLYRLDLNVNDLFPSSTTREQSLLNFTRLLSYASKRNICATGLAKLVSVSTTQNVVDNSGNILKGTTIKWNDPTNEDWLEQFLLIMNSAFTYTSQFGNPTKNVSINNISNQLYQLNSQVNSNCVYSFTASVNDKQENFEVVNPTIDTNSMVIDELTPIPERNFQILYRNDGAGNSSINTGFFVYWKQGTLNSELYNFDQRIENNFVNVNVENINNNDVWFEEINQENGYTSTVWTQIPATEYLSYTNTDNNIRTIYKVETREKDQIKVCFPDGYFGDIPYGLYRLWYRTSDGNSGLYIKPNDIKNVSIQIPYYSNNSNESNVYYLNLTFSVVDVSHIRQSVARETLDSIKENAPAIYSTQDRMVSNKDYNYFPRSIGQSIRVLKAVERTFAGNSRYIDLNDPTGLYSHLNILATDGYLYSDTQVIKSSIAFGTMSGEKIYEKYIEPKLSLKEISNLYYTNYDGEMIPDDGNSQTTTYYYWKPKEIKYGNGQNTMIGGFYRAANTDIPELHGDDFSTCERMDDVAVGDMLCFESFTMRKIGDDVYEEVVDSDNVIWARVEEKFPINEETENSYFVTISEVLDTNKNWKIRKEAVSTKNWSKLYKFNTTIDSNTVEDIIERLDSSAQSSFGLTYIPNETDNASLGVWEIRDADEDWKKYIENDDFVMVPDSVNPDNKIANWFIRVQYNSDTNSWDVDTHEMKIVFGSADQTSFYFNTSNKDSSNDGYFITKDIIKVLKTQENSNYNFTKDYYYKPYNVIKYSDGYIDSQEFCAEGWDGDKDAVIDVPTQFNDLTSKNKKDLIFVKSEDGNSAFLNYVDLKSIYDSQAIIDKTSSVDSQVYKTSLWPYLGQSGYYYTYHKQKELIPSLSHSKQEILLDAETNEKAVKQEFSTFQYNNVRLYSTNGGDLDGTVKDFTGTKVDIPENGIGYDFVDCVSKRCGTPLADGTRVTSVVYDDIILENGDVQTFDWETNTNPEDVISAEYITYSEATEYAFSQDSGKIIKVDFDETRNNETTFYVIENNMLKYYGKEKHGYLYYYNVDTGTIEYFEKDSDYEVVEGVDGLTFLWKHYPTEDYIIDPCSSNIIDMYVLTNTYYNEVQTWIGNGKTGVFPKAPSAYELKSLFQELENNKMISDSIVWHPVNYKLIFGQTADTDTHCIFKVIKTDDLLSDNEVKKAVIQLIDNYFTTMEAGETFYFTQLSTYIELNLQDMIKTCVIVPTDTANKFGTLFQIKCTDNEILLSSATLDDVQIISTITKENIRATS